MKIQKIVFGKRNGVGSYRVKKLTNLVEPRINTMVAESEVKRLCDNQRITVEITDVI